jgi:hypothetical protein
MVWRVKSQGIAQFSQIIKYSHTVLQKAGGAWRSYKKGVL